jgi:predicted alpha/beta hydrolase
MSQLARHADALIMVGSQTPYWKLYDGFWLRMKLFCFWYMMVPACVKLFGYFPASLFGLFEDLPAHVALQWARWARCSNYIFNEFPDAKSNFEILTQRALMISFSDDDLAPPRAVADLQRFYNNVKFENWHLSPEDILQKRIGHFGFFKKRMQPVLWPEVVSWIYKTLSAPTKKAA